MKPDPLTVAIVGADGAGKTTVVRALPESLSIPCKYLYMGPNIESSNVALPWSRLVLRLKLRSYRRTAQEKGITDPSFVSTHHNAHRNVKRGPVLTALANLNRLAEATYREVLAWTYRRRGYVVIYDRLFLFEAPSPKKRAKRASDRAYQWVLTHWFPRPDLVLFLDAPPEVLFARKGEGSPEYLERKRQKIITQGQGVERFVTVDAAQDLDAVISDVCTIIEGAHAQRQNR
jgi:thymidylate kinase